MTSATRPPIDSTETLEQSLRIADSLTSSLGRLPVVEVIRNGWDEPLAVLVQRAFSGRQLAAIRKEALRRHVPDEDPQVWELSEVLPVELRGGNLYPPEMVPILDAVVQGAMGDPHVRAARLHASVANSWFGDSPVHIDYPESRTDLPAGVLHGLNVWVALGGAGVARFAALRTFAEVARVAAYMHDVAESGGSTTDPGQIRRSVDPGQIRRGVDPGQIRRGADPGQIRAGVTGAGGGRTVNAAQRVARAL